MEYIWLVFVVVFLSLQNFLSKQYNIKAKAFNIWLYLGMSTLGALLFFLANAGFRIQVVPEVFPFAVLFALCFGGCNLGNVMAIRSGMFSLSSLVVSYSLIIPTLYGICFLGDRVGGTGYAGITLLLISLYLLNKKKEDGVITLHWLLWVLLAFTGNGLCSTVQKIQQMYFNGGYKNELMVYAMAALTVVFLTTGFLAGKKRGVELKDASGFGLMAGVSNGIVNYLVMVLTGVLPNALLFPMISAGGIIIAFVLSKVLYREHLTKAQTIGYGIGAISVILLNL